ncbi:MAG: NUDIX domain-containing protein [Candidatus Buchananbacteria bacterium]
MEKPLLVIQNEEATSEEKKEFQARKAVMAVLINEDGQIALVHATKHNYHRLSGGSLELDEDFNPALERIISEETGYKIRELEADLGVVIEYRVRIKVHQMSRCFVVYGVKGENVTSFVEKENEKGFRLQWFNLYDAIYTLEDDNPDDYEGKFIRERDLAFLKKYAALEFQNTWFNKLTERQRVVRLIKSYHILKTIGDRQLDELRKMEKNKNVIKTERFMYYIRTLESIWDNTDFAISLSKNKHRAFAFYPVRSIMENTFRLEYFTRKKTMQEQDDIAAREFLRVSKKHYDFCVLKGDKVGAREFKNYYDGFSDLATGDYEDIENVAPANLNPFPSVEQMMLKSKLPDGRDWYYHYAALSESAHGKFMHAIMIKQDETGEYRRSIMYLPPMLVEIVKMTDFHLNGIMKDEVKKAIRRAEVIAKA